MSHNFHFHTQFFFCCVMGISEVEASHYWNDIIAGMLGQLLCIYIVTRFCVEYVRHIGSVWNLSKSHIESLGVWITAFTCLTINTYFLRNLIHDDSININDCQMYRSVRNIFRLWQKIFLYLQFSSVIRSVSKISNVTLAYNDKRIKIFRIFIISLGIGLTIYLTWIHPSEFQRVLKIPGFNNWLCCEQTSSTNSEIVEIVSQFFYAAVGIGITIWYCFICFAQVKLVYHTFKSFLSYFQKIKKIYVNVMHTFHAYFFVLFCLTIDDKHRSSFNVRFEMSEGCSF